MAIEGLEISLTAWCLDVTRFLRSASHQGTAAHLCRVDPQCTSGPGLLETGGRSVHLLGHSDGISSKGGAERMPLPHRFACLPAAGLSAEGPSSGKQVVGLAHHSDCKCARSC